LLTSLALRILLPPAVAAIELDHDLGSKEPTAGARGRGTWVVGDEITRTRARDSGNELLFGLLFAEEIWDAELLASCVVLVWRAVLAPPLLCFLLLL